jgi:hypothetical protein
VTVWLVTPGGNVSVPGAGVKSLPGLAVPDEVAWSTLTVSPDGAERLTVKTAFVVPLSPSVTDTSSILTFS